MTTTTTTASILLTGQSQYVVFVDRWTKHNPYFLTPPDRAHVEDAIGIDQLNSLIEQRLDARSRKDFKESDRIRDELAAKRIVLKDGKGVNGNPITTWEVAR